MPEHAKNDPPWTLRSLNRTLDVALEPCRFCASRDLRLYEYICAKLFAADCRNCGAQRPRSASPARADVLWNGRAARGATPGDVEVTPS